MIRRYLLVTGLVTVIVVIDALTKRWASIEFVGASKNLIPGFLEFTFAENPGSALSLFPDAGAFLGIAAILVSVGVLYALRKERPQIEVVAFGLIVAGAVGNLVDRLFRGAGLLDGKVIDWINLWWIPTFNVADMAVTFSVGLLLIQAWRTRSDS